MYLLLRMDDERTLARPLQGGRVILWGMANFESDLTGGQARCEEMKIANGEVLLIRRFRVVSMGDIKNILGYIFLDDKPGAATKPRWYGTRVPCALQCACLSLTR